MRPTDIEALIAVGRPTVAPDGSFAVFATSRPDISANRNVGQLWRIELPSGEAHRLTRGVADSSPRLSPDGRRVAFVRGDAVGKPQIHVIAASGSEPVQVTDAPLGVGAFAWSPAGDLLAFTARIPEQGRYGSVEGLAAEAESPRRITGVRWHANGIGYIADRPAQVFVVAAPDLGSEPAYAPAPEPQGGSSAPAPRVPAEARQLTSGELSHDGVVFTADGSEILTTTDEIERERRDLRSPLIAISVDGTGERVVLPATLSIADVAVAPDGSIALLASDAGADGTDFVAPGVALWILEGDGPRRLTDPETIDLGEVGSHITAVGDDFLVQNRTRGEVHLLRVSRDGAAVRLRRGMEVTGHGADAAGRRIVCAVATNRSAGELLLLDADGVEARLLTSFGDAASRAGFVVPRELEVTAPDGYRVHGWVATPEGDGPFPVLLQIHGGPYASYGIHLFDETQVLVDAGYAVVYCNPRGSAGYGRAHGRSIRGRMGTDDLVDVLAFLDGAVASEARLDGGRVGIMGGSYGGYLTAWTIAHDHRFAAAIVERGFLDPETFQGTSDIGSFFGDEYVGTDPAAIRAQSPMAMVGRVATPTLVIHSELDFRCPLEQATRYYTALRRQGTEAELLVFPGEDHELTRSGRPRHRVERFEAILDWWGRHLPV
ncbi:dipeptidyl aminopeptidase/acylaminoacyl peptidase [Microbacterium paludicola]|uniref:Dipeptidyl aminopeptidase/acylaminoacyl peptidase n=1 Tax=Microbacterium paludicola TaxID=300019 RepID=A0ABU1HXT5_9MICO|nr:S9 family peptidase [Microbacterium paludicola]MDR6166442.1 dipeptidyl aminopeptidase/acylaminoacyl peptidase [Microbacterium paludicola]